MENVQGGWGWPSRKQWGCGVMALSMGIVTGGAGAFIAGMVCAASLNNQVAVEDGLQLS